MDHDFFSSILKMVSRSIRPFLFPFHELPSLISRPQHPVGGNHLVCYKVLRSNLGIVSPRFLSHATVFSAGVFSSFLRKMVIISSNIKRGATSHTLTVKIVKCSEERNIRDRK